MTAMTLISNRLGYEVLEGSASNIDGDQALDFEAPAGFGDCLIQSVGVQVATIATLATLSANVGVRFGTITTVPLGGIEQPFWAGPWIQVAATSVSAAVHDLFRSVLLRTQESLRIGFSEIDTNVTPTGDFTVRVRVFRLRAP